MPTDRPSRCVTFLETACPNHWVCTHLLLQFLRPRGTLAAVALAANTKIEVRRDTFSALVLPCSCLPALQAEVFSFIGKGLTVAGSYVGSRQDAIEALAFVARGKVRPNVQVESLKDVQSGASRQPWRFVSLLSGSACAAVRAKFPY